MDQQQRPRAQVRWLRQLLVYLMMTTTLVVLSVLVYLGYSLEWTGFGPVRVPKGVQPAKPMWDWMMLLLPAYIAVTATYFGATISRQQYNLQHEFEEQRAREAAVQLYVDGTLNLLANGSLRDSQRLEELRVLLRARTRMVLDRIGATDKGSIVRFLHDAGLIAGEQPAVSLNGADLSEVILWGADLRETNLSGANLLEANLNGADLSTANLSDAHLSDARLRDAHLSSADLRNAKGVTTDQLEFDARTQEGATMPDGKEDFLD